MKTDILEEDSKKILQKKHLAESFQGGSMRFKRDNKRDGLGGLLSSAKGEEGRSL
jgi:hypothetical protein